MRNPDKTPCSRRAILRVAVTCALVLLWMALIFWMSANNADDSSDMSAGLSTWLLNALFGWADPALVESMDHPVRKLAHFVEYAVLGVLLANAARAFVLLRRECAGSCSDDSIPVYIAPAAAAWLIGVLYAASDEFHQSLVPGRSMQFSDICLDAMGVFVGVALFWIAWYALRNRKAARHPEVERRS